MAGLGRKTFVAGDILTDVYIKAFLDNFQSIIVKTRKV